MSDPEVQKFLSSVQGWELKAGAISKTFKFEDFAQAMVFVNRVAELAEEADHHPDILIRYNKVTLTLVTHSAGGLTKKDSALAQEIDLRAGLDQRNPDGQR